MDKNTKKLLWAAIACVLVMAGVLNGIYLKNREIDKTIGTLRNVVVDELQAIDANVVVKDITENEEMSSDETTIEEASIAEEKELEVEEIEKEETERFRTSRRYLL